MLYFAFLFREISVVFVENWEDNERGECKNEKLYWKYMYFEAY